MAASDEVPRGFFIAESAFAAVATFPAVPGISWVVDSIEVEAVLATGATEFAAAWGYGYGTAVNTELGGLYIASGSVAYASASDGTSIEIIGPAGSALSVGMLNGGGSDTTTTVRAHGYPI